MIAQLNAQHWKRQSTESFLIAGNGHARRMPKQNHYTLPESELLTTEQAIKSDPDLLCANVPKSSACCTKAYIPKEIAELLSIATRLVYYWYNRWQQEGLDDLRDKPCAGQPKQNDLNHSDRFLFCKTFC